MKFGQMVRQRDGRMKAPFVTEHSRLDADLWQKTFPGRMATNEEAAKCDAPYGYNVWRCDDGRLLAFAPDEVLK